MRTATLLGLLAACPLLLSCSLLGLDDFETFECTASEQCAPLNERDGIAPDACSLYQCSAGRCTFGPRDLDGDLHGDIACAGVLCGGAFPCDDCNDLVPTVFPGQEEFCDGFDNDCNGVVDDGVSGEPTTTPVITGVTAPGFVHYGLAPDAVAVTMRTEAGGLSFNVLTDDVMAMPPAPPGERTAQSLGFSRSMEATSLTNPAIVDGCPSVATMPIAPNVGMATGTRPGSCTMHEECDDGVVCNGPEQCEPSADPMVLDAMGCRGAQFTACMDALVCNEDSASCSNFDAAVRGCDAVDLATARFRPDGWFAASVVGTDCARGQVRVGYLVDDEPAMDGSEPGRNVLLRGDLRRSTSYLGIDIDDMGCTGASRGGGPTGATRPAIAALPADAGSSARRRPQALAAWLASPASGMAAATPTVELLGLWHEQSGAGGIDVGWVNASNDGVPQPLDEAASGAARPAVAAVDGGTTSGYVVAYGDASGGVALRFIAAFDPPELIGDSAPFATNLGEARPPACTMDAQCPAGSTCMDGDCMQMSCTGMSCPAGASCRMGRCRTDCATGMGCPAGWFCRRAGILTNRECARAPCAADGDCNTGYRCDGAQCVRATPTLDLGTAQTQPSGGGGSGGATVNAVAVATGAVESATAEIGVAWTQADGVWFSRATLNGGSFAGWNPVQLDTADNASEPAVVYNARGIRTDSPGDNGGWFVTWLAAPQLRGQRVAELDGQPVDATPAVLARTGGPREPSPFVSSTGDTAVTRVVFHSRTDNEVKLIHALCGPPP